MSMFAIVVIAVVVVIAAAVLFIGLGRRGGNRGLKRRFGPEYDHALAGHNGDTEAAGQELGERVRRYGSLKERPLSPEDREQYVAQWARIQEQFVDSPHKAVTEADALLARLAQDRGFPSGEQFDEQLAALSVHHAGQVHGYRGVHAAVRGQSGTEEMREAMVEARGLFAALATEEPADSDRHRSQPPDDHGRAPTAHGRHHTKGSGT
ncbi:hypothetical protein ACFWBX_04750 [Streptomyces sp. NPDC059991]|uniref:hypothetical protein n=1 Tax=Streptomyces sp. NPDC059991 TaxID=3347028 RepID=UPI0036C6AF39